MKSRLTASMAGAAALAVILWMAPATAFAQAGENASLPLPPKIPAPGPNLPDFNGVWVAPYTPDLARATSGPIPFTPFGAEKFKTHTGADDPHGYCQPTGPTRAIHSPFPFQIIQTAGAMTILFEIDHNFRRIFTDGRDHPKDMDETWWGDSVGKYSGDTLTVDIAGMSERSWLDTAGHQHSEKLHITETWQKTGPDSIKWTATFEDPIYFTRPWTVTLPMKREKYDIMEMICMDNNRDMPHYITSEKK